MNPPVLTLLFSEFWQMYIVFWPHHNKDILYLHYLLKFPLDFLQPFSSSQFQALVTIDLPSATIVLSFLLFYINEIVQWLEFCVWLLYLMLLWDSSIWLHISVVHSFPFLNCIPLYRTHNCFIYSSVGEHLAFSQSVACMFVFWQFVLNEKFLFWMKPNVSF